jgi:hypothetical protein
MQHADTRTFLKYYLPRRVTVDTQSIVRGLEPQHELMRAACRMSRWIDPRRPWKLTTEQSLSVNEHPRVRRLIERRSMLKGKSTQIEKYIELGKKIQNEKQCLRHALQKEIRRRWDKEQAVTDIERQLSGLTFVQDVKMQLESSVERTPEHKRLIETVMSLPGSTLEEETSRRNAAINAIVVYCQTEEGGRYRPNRQKRSAGRLASPIIKSEEEPQSPSKILHKRQLDMAMISVYKERRPKICFICLGNEKLPIGKRVYSFHTPGDLSKHFRRTHLSNLGKDEQIECKICSVLLNHSMALQNHAASVHGTVS